MRGKRDLLSSTEIFEAKTDNKQANNKQNERKSMNNKFDELAKGLAQSATRRQALKKFGVGLAGMALACFGLANTAKAGCKPYGRNCTMGRQCCSGFCQEVFSFGGKPLGGYCAYPLG
jgi:hypothetical protein